MHGTHFIPTWQGYTFSQQNTPLGLAIPIYTATAVTGGLPLWNPPNSGVMVELVRHDFARTSGTAAIGAVVLMARALTAVATGAICTAIGNTVPDNGTLIIGGRNSKVQSCNGGTVTVTAGAATDAKRTLMTLNLEADTGTAHGNLVSYYDYDGTVIVPPGVLIYVAATLASVALEASSLVWKEWPITAAG